jgi:hypothetical protein
MDEVRRSSDSVSLKLFIQMNSLYFCGLVVRVHGPSSIPGTTRFFDE